MQSEILESSVPPLETDRCPNCESEREGEYCGQCGQKRTHPQNLTVIGFLKNALHELTDLDSKFFKTFIALLFRPGQLTAEYLADRKERFITPVKLYLLISAVYFFFAWGASLEISNFAERMSPVLQQTPSPPGVTQSVFVQQWIEKAGEHSAIARFFSVIGFSLAVTVLYFRKHKFFVKHLVFAFHYYSFDFCFFLLLILPLMLLRALGVYVPPAVFYPGFIVLFVYIFIALRRVYKDSVPKALIKSLALLLCDFVLTAIGDTLALGSSYLATYLSLRG